MGLRAGSGREEGSRCMSEQRARVTDFAQD